MSVTVSSLPCTSQTLCVAVWPRGTFLLRRTDAAAPSVPASYPYLDCCCGFRHWLLLDAESSSFPASTAIQSSAPASGSLSGSASDCTSYWYSPNWHLQRLHPPAATFWLLPLYETRSGPWKTAFLQSHSPPCTVLPCHCRWRAVPLCHPAGCGGTLTPLTDVFSPG